MIVKMVNCSILLKCVTVHYPQSKYSNCTVNLEEIDLCFDQYHMSLSTCTHVIQCRIWVRLGYFI